MGKDQGDWLLTELLFADDAVGADRRSMERAAVELERIITGWGLTLSIGKTKLLVPRSNVDTSVLNGGEIVCVTEFRLSSRGKWRSDG